MKREEILTKIINICIEILEKDDIVLDECSCPESVEEWDSLTHLNIISDIEDEFGISFSLEEMTSMKTIGELVDATLKHIED